jgi:hypothetical protein
MQTDQPRFAFAVIFYNYFARVWLCEWQFPVYVSRKGIHSFISPFGTPDLSSGIPLLLKGSLMKSPNAQDRKLDLKIESIRLTINQIELASSSDVQMQALMDTLQTYERMLVRNRLGIPANAIDRSDLRSSVKHCRLVLSALAKNAPEEMAGWFHGAPPINGLFAWANFLSRMIIDFNTLLNVMRLVRDTRNKKQEK